MKSLVCHSKKRSACPVGYGNPWKGSPQMEIVIKFVFLKAGYAEKWGGGFSYKTFGTLMFCLLLFSVLKICIIKIGSL